METIYKLELYIIVSVITVVGRAGNRRQIRDVYTPHPSRLLVILVTKSTVFYKYKKTSDINTITLSRDLFPYVGVLTTMGF